MNRKYQWCSARRLPCKVLKERLSITWKYGKDGIVLYFLDGTNLEIHITYDREIVGVQNEPYLMAHFGGERR